MFSVSDVLRVAGNLAEGGHHAGLRPVAALIAFAALIPSGLNCAPAQAQGYGYGYESQWWKPAKVKSKKVTAKKPLASGVAEKAPKTIVAVASKAPQGPLVLVVSIRNQRVTVYDASGVVAVSPISSGRVGNPTPMGVYSILEKNKMHYSNLYDSAPMPNMQRITWSGVALHAGVLPGYPASHGCIRLPHGFSQRLYEITKTGARVIVTRDDTPVQSFSHPSLFAATSFVTERAASSGSKVADASGRTVAAQPNNSSLIGIAAAQAATPNSATAEVSPYRKKWLDEMERRSQGLTTAEAAKTDAETKVKQTAEIAGIAADDLKAARLELDKAAQDLKNNEAARNATEKELDAFARSLITSGRPLNDQQALASAQREEALDAKLSELTAKIASQKDEVAALATDAKAAEDLASSANNERKAALNVLSDANLGVKKSQELVEEAKRREAKRNLPIAVFISRQTKKLYARQGYQTILEAPIQISEPDKPFGTHVYTALSVAANSKDVNWSVASVPTVQNSDDKTKDKNRKKDAAKEAPKPVEPNAAGQTPAAALDRITIPEDARELISDAMKPGSSLIVSDYGVSNETGAFTDFIVSLR